MIEICPGNREGEPEPILRDRICSSCRHCHWYLFNDFCGKFLTCQMGGANGQASSAGGDCIRSKGPRRKKNAGLPNGHRRQFRRVTCNRRGLNSRQANWTAPPCTYSCVDWNAADAAFTLGGGSRRREYDLIIRPTQNAEAIVATAVGLRTCCGKPDIRCPGNRF